MTNSIGTDSPPPTGALTFLLTDIEGSTRLWQAAPGAMQAALGRHDAILRHSIEAHGGQIFKTAGDAFYAAFTTSRHALESAAAARRALLAETWPTQTPIRVRMALQSGAAEFRNGDYFGAPLNQVARLLSSCRGGQTLLGASTRAAIGAAVPPAGGEFESHGHYRLKGVDEPVEVFELSIRGDSGFAPPPDSDTVYRVVRAGEFWRPVRDIRHNLAVERDAFVGRIGELRSLALRFDAGTRLLTIVGPGGTGKTRFVRRYGIAWLGDWPGGVYFCDLSEAHTLDGIHFAVAMALGVPLGKDDPGVQLGRAIAGRGRCLVILDNFEQVLAHALVTLGRWLDLAGDASFAVTSRERLQLAGEEIFPLEPLPLENEAIELFTARAIAQKPDFVLGSANRAMVAEVVRLLDGLPLAIELAAARVRVFSPAQLVERMRDRFRLLAGARGAAARQATLRAAIDWSWDLLSPWEQVAFMQCSAFEGGFTLEAAEAVLDLARWPDAPPAVDAVQALVDKSLLRTWVPVEQGRYAVDEPYFGMYLSIHEYAAQKLESSAPGATRTTEQRHGIYFAGFGTDAAIEALFRTGGDARFRALVLELDNVVSACRRAAARRDGTTSAATFRAAWEVLDRKGPFALGAELGAQVLALDGIDTSLRVTACANHVQALRRIGRTAEAGPWLMQALALSRDAGDRRCEGIVLDQLQMLHNSLGRMEEALAEGEAALAIQRALGDRRLEAAVLGHLAHLHLAQGRLDTARDHIESALAIHRDLGNRRAEGGSLAGLAVVCQDLGRFDEARAHYESALAILREVADLNAEGVVLGNLGTLHHDQGRADEARAVYEAARAIYRTIGDRVGEEVTLGNLGELCSDLGLDDEARTYFDAALAIVRETGNRRSEGVVLGALGVLHGRQGRWDAAHAQFDAALAIHRDIGNRRFEGEVLGDLGDVLARQGRLDEARAALRKGEAILREIGDQLDLANLLAISGRVEASAGNFDAARAALAEVEAAAAALRLEPGSALFGEIARLRAALE